MLNKSKIAKHTLILPDLGIPTRRKHLSVQIMVSGRPDTIFFVGFGNEGHSLVNIVKLLETQGITDVAVVAAMPYWDIPPTAKDMQILGIGGTIAATEYLVEKFDLTNLHFIAESQAAAALVYAASKRPELFNGKLALLRPLGLVLMRKRDFVLRMARGAVQREQLLDWRTVGVGSRAAWRTFQDLMQKGEQFNSALTWDIRDQLSKLALEKPGAVRVFAASDDMLYPLEAMKQALEGFGLASLLEAIPGGHSSPAIRAGSRQVKHVLDWCRTGKVSALDDLQ